MRQDKKKVETCGHELAEELNFAFHDITDKTADKPQEPPNNLGSSDSQKDNWVEREQSASEKIMHQILHTVSVADENLKLKAAAAGWTVKPKHHRMRHDTLWTAVERMQWDVFQIDPYKTENHSKMLVVVDPEGYNVSTRIIKTEVKENSLKPSMTLELRKKRLAKEQSNLEYVWGCKQRGISALRKESPLLDTRWSVVKPTGRSTAASLMTFINNKKITAAAEAHTESDSDSSGEDSVPQRSLTRPPIQLTGQSASAAAASFLAEKRPKNNEKPRENNREKTSPSPWGGWVKAHNKRSNTTAQPSGKTPSPRPLLRHRIATEDTKKKQVNSNNPAGDPTPKLEQLLTDFKLSHLLPNFRDKHINDVALLRLKQEDLKELGVPDSDTQTIFLKIQQLRFLGQT